MNIAVCDDRMEVTDLLYKMIKTYFSQHHLLLTSIKIYSDGDCLLQDIQKGSPFDIIFLDIELPGLNGLEVAQFIRQIDSEVLLVFVTGHPEYMSDAFKVEAFDFLSKPVQEEDMELVLSRCIRKYQQRNGQLVIRTSMGTATAHINNIVYVNSDLHYIDFVLTTGESLRTKMQMRQVEELLQPYPQFIRCHQSYLVNLDYVREVQRQNFLLKNINEKSIVSTIPISRKYLTQTKEKFVQHNLRSGRLL